MDDNSTDANRESWWERWGILAILVLMVGGCTGYSTLKPTSEIAVNKYGEPDSQYATIQHLMYGERFYFRQISLLSKEITATTEGIRELRTRHTQQDRQTTQINAAFTENMSATERQAFYLESRADQIREQEFRRQQFEARYAYLQHLQELKQLLQATH